jgi:hypothetical protein
MWNENCSELITHHNQSMNGSTIDNACPHCGILVHDIEHMNRWRPIACTPY